MSESISNLDVEAILARREMRLFLGTSESQSFEAKRYAAYDLDDMAKRFELMKDAVGMANGGGGTIVIGLGQREGESGPDVISQLDLAPQDRLSAHRIESIVRDNTRPSLNVNARWVESVESPGIGVVAVAIPPFKPAAGKHLLFQLLDSGVPLKAIYFGLFEREASGTRVMTLDGAERMLRSGTSETASRLANLESQTVEILEVLASIQQAVDNLGARISYSESGQPSQKQTTLAAIIDEMTNP